MNLKNFFIISNWWGKLLGAGFGYLCAGPIGALLGILVGNFFDRGLANYFTNPHLSYHAEKRKSVQKIFFEATFLIMGYVAKADGRVSEQEIKIAQVIMSEMDLKKEQKNTAQRLFNEGKQNNFQLIPVLIQLKQACKDNPDLLKLFIDIQFRASQVEGLGFQKLQVLDEVFSNLGFAPLRQQYHYYQNFNHTAYHHYQEQQKQQQQSYKPQATINSLEHAFALMEISPGSSKQEVKKAYRRLLSRNHPDKLIAKGSPQEMIKAANEKTQAIMEAYELISKSKGW